MKIRWIFLILIHETVKATEKVREALSFWIRHLSDHYLSSKVLTLQSHVPQNPNFSAFVVGLFLWKSVEQEI